MTTFKSRTTKMNSKYMQAAAFSAMFLIVGCTHTQNQGDTYYQAGNSSYDEAYVATNTQSAGDEGFINYRETAADYREFGERSPIDQNIVTSGGASNMSAAIPPTIEEEVTDYEAEVDAAIEEAAEEASASNAASGEDMVEDWLAEEGSTLKGLLTDWSERAGWRLIWNSNRNYTLSAGAMFRGRFSDVSAALIRTFARARPAPTATFYVGNRVLVVETMEDENAYN